MYEFLRLLTTILTECSRQPQEIAQGKIDGQTVLQKRVESNVHALLKNLQKRGWIEIMPYTPRGIRIL